MIDDVNRAESEGTTRDSFLGGRIEIRQPAEGYRAGGDPVLLAAAIKAKPGAEVLDLGCGVGTASLCLLARLPGIAVTGLEVQPELASLAAVNAAANHLAERFTVQTGSLLAPPDCLRERLFDQVMTNPPWLEAASNQKPRTASKSTGHLESETAGLAVWLRQAVKFLKRKGTLTVIHRADRLGDLLAALAPMPVGGVRILPFWPKRGQPAIRVLVSARKEVKTPAELLPGLLLHEEDGRFTAAAEDVLRRAMGLG